MAAPKKEEFCVVNDYRAVKKQIKKVPGVMMNQEAEMGDLPPAICFGKLDILRGYWQMRLAAEAQEAFIVATPEDLFTPSRVPESVLNATAYFQFVMNELLAGLHYRVWVDEVVWWGGL